MATHTEQLVHLPFSRRGFLTATGAGALFLGGCASNANGGSKSSGSSEEDLSSTDNAGEYLGYDADKQIPSNFAKVAVLSGSWHDMGVQYAQQYPDPIKHYIASKVQSNLMFWESVDKMYEAIPDYEKMLDFFPGYLEFCHGMADELKLSYNDVVLAMLTFAPPETACAAVAAWGSATQDGTIMSAIHSDSPFATVYQQPAILAYPKDGNAFVSYTGFTNSYMNSKGVTCNTTQGFASQEDDTAPGVPACIGALYNAVYASSAKEAVDNHEKHCISGGGEITQYVDATGDAYVIESTASHHAIRKPGEHGEKDYVLQTNGFLTDEMQSSVLPLPDCEYRYNSIEQYLKEQGLGSLTIDDLRSALSNTSYWDAEKQEWVYSWDDDGEKSLYSPENKDATYGGAMRRVYDITNMTTYILMGCEDPLVSKVPEALGTYAKMTLDEDAATTVNNSLFEAKHQVWYAERDMDALDDAAEVERRYEKLDIAKAAIYQGINHQELAGVAASDSERCSEYGKALSALNKAQCYAKAAQSGDIADLIDA